MKQRLIMKLQMIDSHFPDKKSIRLSEVRPFIQNVVGTEVKEDILIQFLKEKGYKQVEIESENDMEDYLSPDDILELDWKPRRFQEGNIERTKEGYHHNEQLLKAYQEDKKEEVVDQLVQNNVKLVEKEASKYINYLGHNLDFDDLVSEGVFGLMEAIKRFDVSRGTQFSTYAFWRIHRAIKRAIENTGTMIRIPVHMIETINRIKKAEQKYFLYHTKKDTAAICEQLGITVEEYKQAKLIEHQFLNIPSLNQFAKKEIEDTELLEFISGETQYLVGGCSEEFVDPSLLIERQDIQRRLKEMLLNSLKPREKEVLIERFGIRDYQPKTLEQIGQNFGVTRERIRQIEAKALPKMRKALKRMASKEDWFWREISNGV